MVTKMNVVKKLEQKYNQYKARALRKGMLFDLHKYQFIGACSKPCYVCGFYDEDIPNGLDRLDNEQGYTRLNVAACCWTCNRAKSNMSLAELKQWASRMGSADSKFDEQELSADFAKVSCKSRSEMAIRIFSTSYKS